MEEYAIVLDYLPQGKSMDKYKEPIVQLIGERWYTLLEASVKKDADIIIGERVYVGKDTRDKIEKIKRRISPEELTASAKAELKHGIEKILITREKEIVEFFNKCGPISIRFHRLELIPGIGKKHMKDILKEREKEPFKSFEDIKNRIQLADVQKLIAQRIEQEINGEATHYLFYRPPSLFQQQRRRFSRRR